MEITIEEALKKAIGVHKEGKLQEAERLYKAVLKAKPLHPDASHNLGVLAMSVNKSDAALALFEVAIKSNPKIEQYWLSYIEALLKENQLEKAREVFSRGKNEGLFQSREGSIEKKLSREISPLEYTGTTKSRRNNEQNEKHSAPSRAEIQNLLKKYEQGRYRAAERIATSITEKFPANLISWKVLGSVLKHLGRLNESLVANERATKLSPDDAEAHNNLGNTLRELGKLQEAKASFRQAIILQSEYTEAHYNLGNTLNVLGDLKDALVCFKRAIVLKPEFAGAHVNAGLVLQKLKKFPEAIKSFKRAVEITPDAIEPRMFLNAALNSSVPSWHLPMMNDKVRNDAYALAIEAAVEDGAFVLDIGTGSGLLSLMAAANGARRVVTCESSNIIADTAQGIISENGFDKKISVLNKVSTDLRVPQDLSQKADLIISEVLSGEFVGEGVRATVLDARKRLLKKNGRMIPQAGKIKIALIGDNHEVLSATSVAKINGFNLSKFNLISQNKFSLKLKEKPILLSEPNEVFSIDLCNVDDVSKIEKNIKLRVNQDGLCLGLIQWLWVQLYEEIQYENVPGEIESHWPTPIYPFDKPVEVKKGDIIDIRALLGENNVWFYKAY